MWNDIFHYTDGGLSTIVLKKSKYNSKSYVSPRKSVSQAASICSSLNMSLISIETVAELLKLIPSTGINHQHTKVRLFQPYNYRL
jgi:hypothetical protein